MKILLVNKFYYRRGGDCVVVLNTEALLRDMGHEVAVFSMNYPDNLPCEQQDYFASEVQFAGGIGAKVAALRRTLGQGDVVAQFKRLLHDFAPDVVHLHNIHSYISPVVAQLAHEAGCRVVWTLHDYKLLCPSYACQRDGKPCELCFHDKSHVVRTRCMKGSLAASVIAWLEAKKWNRKVLERYTHTFICPSQFMADKMRQGGFDPAKLKVLCNFVDPEKLARFEQTDTAQRSDYYCYVGRLSEEKGVEALLEAAAALPFKLMVAGGGPLEAELRQRYGDRPNITFLGMVDGERVATLLAGARCSVMPSRCYDNNPLGVIESLCSGTPVVGTPMGGIPELVDKDHGIVTADCTPAAIAAALHNAFERKWDYNAIKQESLKLFSPETHYQKLLNIYSS
ncbi:MAG: glycosyltransferase family 4 protein [Muribaculaceae bacterium]|nr:glycosyltransferase family 4 protein [Muribaculaceae bacterium]MBQ4006374.1 glycosyltransferase family 4 protein [Muribaculaceae bacterium]